MKDQEHRETLLARVCLLYMTAVFFIAEGLISAQPGPTLTGNGLCQFALHDYNLPAANEQKINQIVSKALEDHQRVFGFKVARNFHVRIRIFGRFEDYQQFARTNYHPAGGNPVNLTNLHGFYNGSTREIVTWRQEQPSYLANNILHEASHAIVRGHFRRVPPWISEGCATYFAFPRYIQDSQDISSLKNRWARLNAWLKAGTLPELKKFVNLNDVEWQQCPPYQAYTVSWSIFQYLMSSAQNQYVLADLMKQDQQSRGPIDCAGILEKLYPGGCMALQQHWHHWITEKGGLVLAPGKDGPRTITIPVGRPGASAK